MSDYRISQQAEQDLADIYRYGVEHFGEAGADAFYDALFDCFDLIAQSPLAWPRVDHIREGYRRYVFRKGRGRTSIYYRVTAGPVEVMAVLQRQDTKTIR